MANLIWLVASLLVPLVWLVPHVGLGMHPPPVPTAVLSGLSIVAAAFLLSWASELAERYVPPAFALIVLALISVLPEYAVDMHFAWMAGREDAYRAYAVANMTGANRILIGIGWTMLVFLQYARFRRSELDVEPARRLELGFLLLASIYALVLPWKSSITLLDAAIFFGIFGFYVFRALKTEHDEGELVGPAAWLSERLGDPGRIAVIVGFLAYACAAIWFAAEPFAESLVAVGNHFGVNKFVLIQLVAPLASESPEFIVAILFLLRNRGSMALGALLSSKVNQWTLLVGAIPVFYSASRWTDAARTEAYTLADAFWSGMHLEAQPNEELLLTAAQSLFAVAVLSDLRFGMREAITLFVLFVLPWLPGLNTPGAHYVYSAFYLLLTLGVGLGSADGRKNMVRLLKLRG